VQRARSYRGNLKSVKGYKTRYLELTEVALAAFKRQKAHTFLKAHGYVFENPVTGNPWHDERSQRDHYWTPALKRCGIRHRGSYHTRHTFATIVIMVGCNATWVAKQMGNSPRVIYKHYARWIDAADKSNEIRRLNAALKRANFSPAVPNFSPTEEEDYTNQGVIGRRDWTRTNDPHHVKVVL
jgi:integrase